jgi:hypothetical protein
MSNNLPVSESRRMATRPADGRVTAATVLIAAAIVALATTSLIYPRAPATAQPADVVVRPALAMAAEPMSVPLDSGEVGPFAMGYVVYDWNPADGVPGFDPWPPGARR